jgi:hypothetical protein
MGDYVQKGTDLPGAAEIDRQVNARPLGQLRGQSDRTPGADRVHPEEVAEVIVAHDRVEVVDKKVAAEHRERLVARPFDAHRARLRRQLHLCGAVDRAPLTVVSLAPYLRAQRVAADLREPVEGAQGEVTRRQDAFLVGYLEVARRAVLWERVRRMELIFDRVDRLGQPLAVEYRRLE